MPGFGYDSEYWNGGANMLLNSRFGGDGSGGGGGGGNLNSQFNATANWDPSALMNPMLKYGADMVQYDFNKQKWLQGNARRLAQKDANKVTSRNPAGPGLRPTVQRQVSPTQTLLNNADRFAASDPDWGGILKSGNLRHKWLPAAGKMQGINFDNGWDQYANLAQAGSSFAPAAGKATLDAQLASLYQDDPSLLRGGRL